MKKIICIAFSVLWLTACSVFSPVAVPPQNTYVINTVPAVIYKKTTRPMTLLVLMPETNSIYDTTAMAYTIHPYQVAFFAKNAWADTPAKMLQPLIVQSLRKTHYFHAVVTSSLERHNYILATQIQQLQQDFIVTPSLLRFYVHVQLIRAGTNRVIAEKQFSLVEIMPSQNPYGGVIAANQATADLLVQLSQFCLHTLR